MHKYFADIRSRAFVLSALLICVLLSACERRAEQHTPHMELNCQVISRSTDTLVIRAELINKGYDSFSYFTMSCDSLFGYSIDSKKWRLIPRPCQKNIPVTLNILPHGSIKTLIRLLSKGHSLKPDTVLRVGFNPSGDYYPASVTHTEQIIWSKNLLN
jgi:hypothetical protein